MKLSIALALLDDIRQAENGAWKSLCPAHTDRNPSLSISSGEKQELVLHCHAGCDYDDIHKALRSRLKLLDTTYLYKNAHGKIIGRVKRTYDNDGNKNFYQQVPNGTSWKNGSSVELKHTPYRLPELLAAIENGKRIFIVEGEKDVDRLFDEGHTATCNAQGAGKWTDEHSKWLAGAKRIFIVRDKDDAGSRHAWAVFDSIEETGGVRKTTVHVSPFGKDISEHLDSGHELRELEQEQPSPKMHSRLISGYSFIFDTPAEVPAVWGRTGKEVLWAKGQGFMVVAPEGVGKSTLANLLVESLLGLTDSVLDFTVAPTNKRIIYMAMDRPSQLAGSARRIFEKYHQSPSDVKKLKEQLLVWPGPPEHDFAKHPELLTELAQSAEADIIFIDSLKDAVLALSKEETGQGWNRAVQSALMEGIQICILNHPVKMGNKEVRPMTLDDVYGSRWITAGLGSVLSLWGENTSSFALLSHLKSPSTPIDPLTIKRNGRTGEMTAVGTILDWAWFFIEPHTAADLAKEMFPDEGDNNANKAKARRQVDDLLGRGTIVKHSKTVGEVGRQADRYILREPE